jgi:hypothetical protein
MFRAFSTPGHQLLDHQMPYAQTPSMPEALKKITVNVPAALLDAATRVTGKGITPTIVEGLEELEKRAKRSALRDMRGRVAFDLDLKKSRSR